MDFSMDLLARILTTIGFLVVLVNLITEVFKYVFEVKSAKTINGFVWFVSEVLTIAFFLAYCQINSILLTWYMMVAIVVIGALVAYAAMFGYDKLLSYFKGLKNENKS